MEENNISNLTSQQMEQVNNQLQATMMSAKLLGNEDLVTRCSRAILAFNSNILDHNPTFEEMLDEINNTDMSLPPDLQEIIDMPSIDTPDGFLDTIFGELPEGMSVPSDIWSMLKGIAHNILDF